MKRLLIMLLVCVPVVAMADGRKIKKANEDTEAWRYEIEPVTTGVQGSVVLKVWSFSKKTNIAAEQSKKNAVHGVIFKGFPTKDRVTGRKPLVTNPAEHEAFFEKFFADGGEYMRFVALTNSGDVGGGDVMKVSKKEYKVGVTVTISYNDLRKYLEDQGVVRSLGSGF